MNQDNVLTVSNITELIKITLKETIPNHLCVTGEISNYKPSKSGLFFTLKDSISSINVAIWNNCHKNLTLSDGKQVKLWANLVVYGKSGTYNLNGYKLELLGTGNLYQDYIALKDHYNKAGYFDDDKKKQLPKIINKVGLATALGGAALQDFLYIIKQNNFEGTIYVKNCIVQGKDCPLSVAKALVELDDMKLDVIVITRGGGGYEDLCGFSDANVIEALHKCKTCTISAIGHEIDFMLSDFAADIRAPTPSIASQIITAQSKSVYDMAHLMDLKHKLVNMISTKIKFIEYDLQNIKLTSPMTLIERQISNVGIVRNQLLNIINQKLNHMEYNINNIGLKSPLYLIEQQIINAKRLKDFLFDILTRKINNMESVLKSIGVKESIVIYSIEGVQLNNAKEFLEAMNKRKKLKIKFIDGEVSMDIRNIK